MSLSSEDHIRLLKALISNGVRFLIIGGHASIYYGVNRNTGDLDILIDPTASNGSKVVNALKEIELEVPEISPSEFEKELVLSFGLSPDAVDILNYTPGIQFETAYQNAITTMFQGLTIKIIDIRDLIRNKEHLQRKGDKSLLDKYDVEVLKKILKKQEEK